MIRQPFAPGDLLPFWAYGMPIDDHHLYDADDHAESENLVASHDATEAAERLREALVDIDAPPHQLARLGLS